MKKYMMIFCIVGCFSGMAFAEETSTECPMMKELNDRSNPKANMSKEKAQQPKSATSSKQ